MRIKLFEPGTLQFRRWLTRGWLLTAEGLLDCWHFETALVKVSPRIVLTERRNLQRPGLAVFEYPPDLPESAVRLHASRVAQRLNRDLRLEEAIGCSG